jgi:hypothetical protein
MASPLCVYGALTEYMHEQSPTVSRPQHYQSAVAESGRISGVQVGGQHTLRTKGAALEGHGLEVLLPTRHGVGQHSATTIGPTSVPSSVPHAGMDVIRQRASIWAHATRPEAPPATLQCYRPFPARSGAAPPYAVDGPSELIGHAPGSLSRLEWTQMFNVVPGRNCKCRPMATPRCIIFSMSFCNSEWQWYSGQPIMPADAAKQHGNRFLTSHQAPDLVVPAG